MVRKKSFLVTSISVPPRISRNEIPSPQRLVGAYARKCSLGHSKSEKVTISNFDLLGAVWVRTKVLKNSLLKHLTDTFVKPPDEKNSSCMV